MCVFVCVSELVCIAGPKHELRQGLGSVALPTVMCTRQTPPSRFLDW